MTNYERAVGVAALRQFGRVPNIIKAIEELAELQQALCKNLTAMGDGLIYESVCEEMADVEIMLGRLKMLFDPETVQEWKERKLERTAELLGVGICEGKTTSSAHDGAPSHQAPDQREG